MNSSKKRITMKLQRPNPLFEQWLMEWRDKAIETDSKMQHCFGKALQSLQKYPLVLETGRDCRVLQGFGEKLCQMLDKNLLEYKRKNPDSFTTNKSDINVNNSKNMKQKTPKRKMSDLNCGATQKEYIPAWRSGAYAILLTLYKKSLESQYVGYMLKAEIIKYGQQLCDKSFLKPDPGSYYTAWSSMKTLLDKNLVTKHGSPAKISLTDEGVVLAHKLYRNSLNDKLGDDPTTTDSVDTHTSENKRKKKSEAYGGSKFIDTNKSDKDIQNIAPCLSSERITRPIIDSNFDTESISSSNASQDEAFVFNPHSFDIILLVDKQETSGGSKNFLDDPVLAELTQLNVLYEVRHLKVGDYTWICRHNISKKELILPYIVERKRMDDFGSSIKDGRFHEQKFRLKQCGIQNLVYLIESYGSNTHTGLPIPVLQQAATNTLLQDGFSVKFTDNLRGTAEYLASFSLILQNIFKSKILASCPKQNLVPSTIEDDLMPLMTFDEFNKGASKSRNFKVKELFIRQLLQLKGVSVEKAMAVVEKYPTPGILQTTYTNYATDGEKLLSTLHYGKLNKKIGPVISKTIYQLYTNSVF